MMGPSEDFGYQAQILSEIRLIIPLLEKIKEDIRTRYDLKVV